MKLYDEIHVKVIWNCKGLFNPN